MLIMIELSVHKRLKFKATEMFRLVLTETLFYSFLDLAKSAEFKINQINIYVVV